MLITPEYVFKDVTHITPEWLAQKGIRALVLDIDNTLTADRSQELPDEVAGWLDTMRKAGVRLTIVSNGAEKRVRPFAQKLGLAYLYRSAKPLPFALMAAQHRMGVKHSQMAMVGDQLYADRMAAALYGIPGLMVIPRGPDLGAQVGQPLAHLVRQFLAAVSRQGVVDIQHQRPDALLGQPLRRDVGDILENIFGGNEHHFLLK